MNLFTSNEFNSLQDLFLDQIRDLYDAEQRIVKALPKMIDSAQAPELKQAFQHHLQETEQHVTRLERIFNQIGTDAKRETCQAILEKWGGRVPDRMEDLLTLPGVGRKTANLVLILSHASRDNICVDTHVHRLANRLGWVRTRTPEQTEHALYKVLPRRWWPRVNLFLVTWGQQVCHPVYPRCRACVISRLCAKVGVERVGKA